MLILLSIGVPSFAADTYRLNPARLAFITDESVYVTNELEADIATDITDFDPGHRYSLKGVDPYALKYQREGAYHIYYLEDGQKVYTFETGNGSTTFDEQLSDWGFDVDDSRVIDEITSWYDNVQMTGVVHDHMNTLSLIPSVSFIQKGFYASYERSISAYGNPGSTVDVEDQHISIARNETLIIGLSSTDAHFISIGASGHYTRTTAKDFRVPRFEDYDSRECEDPDDITKGLVEGTLFRGAPVDHRFDMTLGAMARIGRMYAGVTSFVPVFPLENGSAVVESFVRELSAGLSFGWPAPDHSGVYLSAEAQVNRINSSTGREFFASSGIRLHASRHLRAEVEASYRQPIPGTFTELADRNTSELIDPSIGTASFGAGLQLLHARVDVSMSLPAMTAGAYISSWIQGTGLPGLFDNGGPVIHLSGSTVF